MTDLYRSSTVNGDQDEATSSASLSKSQTSFRVSAVNSTTSAFCAFVFNEDFFSSIRFLTPRGQPRKVECQVSVKSLLASLKTHSSKQLERCQILVTDSGRECRIAIKLHHQHGVTKTHKLTYEAHSALFPSANPDPGGTAVISAQTIQEWLVHFSATGRGADISFWCAADFCNVRSKSDDYETGKTRKSITTEVKVEISQFEVFHVPSEVYLTLPLKEFKAIVLFAEAVSAPLEMHFSTGGEPVFVRIWSEELHAEMVIATTEAKIPETATPRGARQEPQPNGTAPRPTSPAQSIPRSAQRPAGGAAGMAQSPGRSGNRLLAQQSPTPRRAEASAQQTPATRGRDETSQQSQTMASLPTPAHRESQLPRASTPQRQRGEQARSPMHPRDAGLSPVPEAETSSRRTPGVVDGSDPLFRGQSSQDQRGDEEAASRRTLPSHRLQPQRPGRDARSIPPPTASTPLTSSDFKRRKVISDSDPSLLRVQRDEFAGGSGDPDDSSFDYAEALDELEAGIEKGSLKVYGSQSVPPPAASGSSRSAQRQTTVAEGSKSNGVSAEEVDKTIDLVPRSQVSPQARRRNASRSAGDHETGAFDASTTADETADQSSKSVAAGAGEHHSYTADFEDEVIPGTQPASVADEESMGRQEEDESTTLDEESLPRRRKKFKAMW